jgi:hypothetical protein
MDDSVQPCPLNPERSANKVLASVHQGVDVGMHSGFGRELW